MNEVRKKHRMHPVKSAQVEEIVNNAHKKRGLCNYSFII